MCQDTQKTARICTDGNARFMDKKIPTNFRNAGKITRKQVRERKKSWRTLPNFVMWESTLVWKEIATLGSCRTNKIFRNMRNLMALTYKQMGLGHVPLACLFIN